MPAQSPTLSPTLSAITAGLRGSSSGIPASTLPTRSAPTSAPLVKMPPPRRAKIEISEPPKARPTSGSMMWGRPSFIAFGVAHVGAHRHVHADVAGEARKNCTDGKASRGASAQRPPDDREQDDADDAD